MLIDLQNRDTLPRQLEEELALGDLARAGEPRLEVQAAHLCAGLVPTPRGVEMTGSLDAQVGLECGRCLEPYSTLLRAEFSLLLVPDAQEFGVPNVEVRPEDADLFYAEDGQVDTRWVAQEQILLNLPLKPVCAETCRGLCPACGENRNHIECGCREEIRDPRMAALIEFKRRTRGS